MLTWSCQLLGGGRRTGGGGDGGGETAEIASAVPQVPAIEGSSAAGPVAHIAAASGWGPDAACSVARGQAVGSRATSLPQNLVELTNIGATGVLAPTAGASNSSGAHTGAAA